MFCFLSIYLTPDKKRNIYLSIFVFVEFIIEFTYFTDLWDYISSNSEPGTMRTCDSPTQWVEMEGTCLLQGLIYEFVEWMRLLLLLSAITELWLRVVPQVKKLNKLYFVVPYTIILLSMSLWLLFDGDGISFPAGTGNIHCRIQNPKLRETRENVFEGIVYTCFAIYVWAMWKCIYTTLSANKAEKPLMKLWRTYRVLFFIGIISLVFLIDMIRIEFIDTEKIEKSIVDWNWCLFMEFINPIQEDYLGYCGKTPKHRFELSFLYEGNCFLIAKAILLFMATLNEQARNEYLKYLAVVENKLFKTSYIQENFVDKKRTMNAFATSQVSRGVTSSNVVQSTILDSSYEAVEKYKPQPDLFTLKELPSKKYAVAPAYDDESKDQNPDIDNSNVEQSEIVNSTQSEV